MDHLIVEKNKAVLSKIAGVDAVYNLNQSIVDEKVFSSLKNPEPSFVEWYTNPRSYIVLQDWIPRDQTTAERWKHLAKPFLEQSSISSLINDEEIDPHLLFDLASLREAVEQSKYDPIRSLTTTQCKVSHLIAFGTGDGKFLSYAIQQLDPISLTVVVTEWEDFASSFLTIDWLELWNSRCKNNKYRISIIKVPNDQALKMFLGENNYALVDHALLYCSPVADNNLKEIYESMHDSLLSRSIHYLGFAMDEYNMIWNSWDSLRRTPRIFQKPQARIDRNISCIVCGSGPSLDNDIKYIKELSQTHVIIACASNYGTLRKNGIDVDILCLLERGDFMINQYKSIVEEYGSGKTRLLASVTTPAPLQDLFLEPMVYFRPALTPLAIFAEDLNQILLHEGPQTVNTGVAFALAIGAAELILSGVDLGTASLTSVRSKDAIGESPRDFDIEVPGNHKDAVYTNSLLLDGKIGIESTIESFKLLNTKLLNASNGIKIKGFAPIELNEYIKSFKIMSLESAKSLQESKKVLWQWWSRQARYEPTRFMARWNATNPRQQVHSTISSIRELLNSNEPWLPEITSKMSALLSLTNISNSQQFARRVVRGHLIKLNLAITRQLRIMSDDPEKQSLFYKRAKTILLSRLDHFEREMFLLIDSLENSPKHNS